jgi:hypothetical protein
MIMIIISMILMIMIIISMIMMMISIISMIIRIQYDLGLCCFFDGVDDITVILITMTLI